ncbi:MAG: DUF4351 domain-containing protein [Gammaproteobacteria bacterium]|jgi:hypothetical protein|nr:DUF4351 domain-containing protein [Gammaproteobacteria bacterium]
MTRYDATIKDVLWRGAPALLRQLTGSPVARIEATEFASARSRRPDLLARLSDGRLFHLELQSQADPHMAWRMLDYYGLIAARYGYEPLFQIVLALTDAAARGLPRSIDHPRIRFDVSVISMAALDPTPLLASDYPDDNVLAILCRTDDIKQRAADILARILPLPENDRRDVLTRLLILAGLRHAEPILIEELERMPVQIDIREHPYLMSLVAEFEAKSKAEGKAEGKAEVLLRLLERRFPSLPDNRRAQIRAAPLEQLDLWLDAVLDADTLDAVFDRTAH